MIETIKQHLGAMSAIITVFVALAGGIITVEGRYAHADDVRSVKELATFNLNQIRIEQANNVDLLRKQSIEDRLFELRLKDRPIQAEKAMLERYKDQLNEVNRRIESRQLK